MNHSVRSNVFHPFSTRRTATGPTPRQDMEKGAAVVDASPMQGTTDNGDLAWRIVVLMCAFRVDFVCLFDFYIWCQCLVWWLAWFARTSFLSGDLTNHDSRHRALTDAWVLLSTCWENVFGWDWRLIVGSLIAIGIRQKYKCRATRTGDCCSCFVGLFWALKAIDFQMQYCWITTSGGIGWMFWFDILLIALFDFSK